MISVLLVGCANDETFEIIVKPADQDIVESGMPCWNNALWIKYSNGKEELLVSEKEDEDVKKGILEIKEPHISPDRTKVYFLSQAWVTSNAVHVVDIQTKEEKYLCPGNSLEVIQSGAYKGKLVVEQHRYHNGGGSYDHYYLLDEAGKEIKDLGETFTRSDENNIGI